MKALFVTGTDTGAGKTIVTGLLARFLKDKGLKVVTQKWIQTGSRTCQDIKVHHKIMGISEKNTRPLENLLCPYRFLLPASPHLAARAENKRISASRIKMSFKFLSKKFDFIIVEGIGGALVPLDNSNLTIDIAKKLNLPVLIVAQNKLGAINHTLMTVEALKSRKIKISGILFNNFKNQDGKILRDNPRIIGKLTGIRILGILPWDKRIDFLYKKITPAARKIFK